jgi:hypothetical protein
MTAKISTDTIPDPPAIHPMYDRIFADGDGDVNGWAEEGEGRVAITQTQDEKKGGRTASSIGHPLDRRRMRQAGRGLLQRTPCALAI